MKSTTATETRRPLGSTARAAASIRAALKAQGWTSRDVSVRSDVYSMGSAIRVVVKSPGVSLAAVARIAKEHESVRRDEATGEILGGGNQFVDVTRDSATGRAMAAPVLAEIAALEVGQDTTLECGAVVTRESAYEYRAFRGPLASPISCWGAETAARQIAEALVDAAAELEGARPRELSERECAEQLPVPGLAPVVSLASRRS